MGPLRNDYDRDPLGGYDEMAKLKQKVVAAPKYANLSPESVETIRKWYKLQMQYEEEAAKLEPLRKESDDLYRAISQLLGATEEKKAMVDKLIVEFAGFSRTNVAYGQVFNEALARVCDADKLILEEIKALKTSTSNVDKLKVTVLEPGAVVGEALGDFVRKGFDWIRSAVRRFKSILSEYDDALYKLQEAVRNTNRRRESVDKLLTDRSISVEEEMEDPEEDTKFKIGEIVRVHMGNDVPSRIGSVIKFLGEGKYIVKFGGSERIVGEGELTSMMVRIYRILRNIWDSAASDLYASGTKRMSVEDVKSIVYEQPWPSSPDISKDLRVYWNELSEERKNDILDQAFSKDEIYYTY